MSETQNPVNENSLGHTKKASDGSGLGLNNIDFILDIPLEVTVRLGRARMPISELIELGAGSVIELDRIAGEPLEVLVNNKLVARGEAVVISDKFGVRLTEIVSPTEKILDLNG